MCRRTTLRTKIMARVEVQEGEDGCWIWTGADSGTGRGGGYPRMDFDGGKMAVHRALWIIENGPIPSKKQLDHTCRTRRCVRPDHCELVTHRENQRRRARAARK